jgi:hypothetical protein
MVVVFAVVAIRPVVWIPFDTYAFPWIVPRLVDTKLVMLYEVIFGTETEKLFVVTEFEAKTFPATERVLLEVAAVFIPKGPFMVVTFRVGTLSVAEKRLPVVRPFDIKTFPGTVRPKFDITTTVVTFETPEEFHVPVET